MMLLRCAIRFYRSLRLVPTMRIHNLISSYSKIRNLNRLFLSLSVFCIISVCYFGHMVYESYIYTCSKDYGYSKYKFDNLDNITISPINIHPYKFKLLAESLCNTIPEVYLLAVVKSATKNSYKRHCIRQTWGRESNSGNRRLVFILGYNEEDQTQVESESRQFNDIIQENFQDGYWSNTYKMEMAFNWITKYCSNAKYAVFVDDDMYLNMPNTLKYLHSVDERKVENLYSGLVVEKPFPTRDYFNKHYISRQDYPLDCFPPYIPSGTVFFSKAVIRKIQKLMPYIPHFREDDVYLGMVAQKSGVTPSKINFLIGLGDDRSDLKFLPCLISDHGYTTLEMFQSAYNETHSKNLTVEKIMEVCIHSSKVKEL
ncbi:beta-1,3-galactosyltransferase brn-like [Saccostrea echinata]|uniref:beta-1,3-galactosyltransferase brn-like n=1 Tax=Saccostrea echinata TaxID=191078 RepID=UPI002A8137FD|nr:beta-1,3-galactosyltransferase brn-like [Saccostrea echinata]